MYGYPRYFDYFNKEQPKVKNEYDEGRVEVNIIENNAEKDYYPQNGWDDQTESAQEAAVRQNAPENKEIASETPSVYANFVRTPASAYASAPADAPVSAPAVVPASAPTGAPVSAPVSTATSTPDSTAASSQASLSAKANTDTPVSAPVSKQDSVSEDSKAGALSIPAVKSLYDAPGGYGVPDWLRDLYPERKERSYVVINIICSDYRLDRE